MATSVEWAVPTSRCQGHTKGEYTTVYVWLLTACVTVMYAPDLKKLQEAIT